LHRYSRPEDEQTKNQLIAQLFQAANVNPLAGCLPAFAQIPIFLSLYRALQNLIAEDKLEEPFLWVPNLEGPVFMKPPGESLDWIKSVFTGNPELGWQATIAYFSLPFILFISQSISTRVLQPPKDPNRVMSDQELTTQGIINNLPFIVAFFSLNVPAGLGLYWIVNNILTTAITLSIKARFKDEPVPAEVSQMMAAIDADTGVGAASRPRAASSAAQELGRGMGSKMSEEDRERLRKFEERSGFGKAQSQSPSVIDVNPIASDASAIPSSSPETPDASTDTNSVEPKGPLGKTLKFINEKIRDEDAKTTEQQDAINKEIAKVALDKKSKRKGKNRK
jgi:YidC/Oxa1 family membrane protein insertase